MSHMPENEIYYDITSWDLETLESVCQSVLLCHGHHLLKVMSQKNRMDHCEADVNQRPRFPKVKTAPWIEPWVHFTCQQITFRPKIKRKNVWLLLVRIKWDDFQETTLFSTMLLLQLIYIAGHTENLDNKTNTTMTYEYILPCILYCVCFLKIKNQMCLNNNIKDKT